MQFNDKMTFLRKGGSNRNNTAVGNRDIHILECAVVENRTAGQQQTHDISPSVYTISK